MKFLDKIFGNQKPKEEKGPVKLLSSNPYSSKQTLVYNGGFLNDLEFVASKESFNFDQIRAAIKPIVTATSKLVPKHICNSGINPQPWLNKILKYPNQYCSMQDFLKKLITHRELYGNAYAYVKRDSLGYPIELHNIPWESVELKDLEGELFLKFRFFNDSAVVPYTDVIHLRKDFNKHDIFGDKDDCLDNVIAIMDSSDKALVKSSKYSGVVKWLVQYKFIPNDETVELEMQNFIEKYLNSENSTGVMVSNPNFEITPIKNDAVTLDAEKLKYINERIYSFFGVNENILQNKYNEIERLAFYEGEIEPRAMQLSSEFTRVLFTERARSFGNEILFESNTLIYSDIQTKLSLVAMVDRGALTPNEWRKVLNLTPIEGGDTPLRRLDTVTIDKGGDNEIDTKGIQDDGNADPQ